MRRFSWLVGVLATLAVLLGTLAGPALADPTAWQPELEDYFIARIGPDEQTSTQFWGILLNFQFTPVGTPITATVTDGQNGQPTAGATVGPITPGLKRLTAERSDSIRSNSLYVAVRR